MGDAMAGRCRLAASYAQPVQAADPDAVRTTDTTLYNSIFRFDDQVLVNAHVWGCPASEAPVLHYQHRGDHGIAATVLRSFDRIWEAAQPLAAG